MAAASSIDASKVAVNIKFASEADVTQTSVIGHTLKHILFFHVTNSVEVSRILS